MPIGPRSGMFAEVEAMLGDGFYVGGGVIFLILVIVVVVLLMRRA